MYAGTLGPGQQFDFLPPSENGVDLLYSHESVARMQQQSLSQREATDLYQYVVNNPVCWVDPSGLDIERAIPRMSLPGPPTPGPKPAPGPQGRGATVAFDQERFDDLVELFKSNLFSTRQGASRELRGMAPAFPESLRQDIEERITGAMEPDSETRYGLKQLYEAYYSDVVYGRCAPDDPLCNTCCRVESEKEKIICQSSFEFANPIFKQLLLNNCTALAWSHLNHCLDTCRSDCPTEE